MKVKDLMQSKVWTVSPSDTIDRVFLLLKLEKIRHLPVTEKDKVVGMVSDRDLSKIWGSIKTQQVKNSKTSNCYTIQSRTVRTMMRRGVITTAPNTDAGDAAAIMAKKKIGALPVMEKGKLVGIITSTDILRAFVPLSRTAK
jgi:acetoin utilization protein AcuB